MHEPLSDKVPLGEREPAAERRPAAHLEREVRLDAGTASDALIRQRLNGGFYHTPAVAEIIARRIADRGDL